MENQIIEFKIDAYSPQEMAERVEKVGVAKARLDFWTMFALSILAGAFIGLGAVYFTLVIHDSKLSFGLTQLIGGLAFSLGLILVVIGGAELFTGNTLITMAFASGKIKFSELFRNWLIVYLGNFLGALTLVSWIYFSGHWIMNQNLVGVKALLIASTKVNLDFTQALIRGILCNALVCLAVWLCFSRRSVVDKILSIIFPISAFVACGFEHSIANMYFIPLGIILKTRTEVIEATQQNILPKTMDLSNLTWYNFFVKNLLPVTVGNIIGGVALVGIVYWFIYLRKKYNRWIN
jgi:formate/nitrite transporter